MLLEKNFLLSKVARRMLGFFVMAAFIPILLLAYLSYWESTQLLLKETHTRLEAASDVYKKSIYERLLLSDQLLFDLVQRFSEQEWSTNIERQLHSRFRSIHILSQENRLIHVFGKIEKLPFIQQSTVTIDST